MSLLLLFPASTGGLKNYGYTGIGGDIDGGIAAYLRSVGFAAIGGDLDGGTATYLRSAGMTASGGDIDGGIAIVLGTLGRSGGGTTTVPLKIIMVDGKLAVNTGGKSYIKV
jgi:hypothetical protein